MKVISSVGVSSTISLAVFAMLSVRPAYCRMALHSVLLQQTCCHKATDEKGGDQDKDHGYRVQR